MEVLIARTLMMHLEHPEKSLEEMIRILKPGGLIMCKEPDNLSGGLAKNFFSVPDLKVEEKILFNKLQLCCHYGRMKLGRGDETIGNQIPHLLAEFGMKEIDIRMNDKVLFMEPPYATEVQKHRLKITKRNVTNRKERLYWIKRMWNPDCGMWI